MLDRKLFFVNANIKNLNRDMIRSEKIEFDQFTGTVPIKIENRFGTSTNPSNGKNFITVLMILGQAES
jgi:hypothetical protein